MSIPTVAYREGAVELLDQTRLPGEVVVHPCPDIPELVDAIRRLRVRGAPAIGVAAAYGVVLSADLALRDGLAGEAFPARIREDIATLRASRPTAVNLGWALDRLATVLDRDPSREALLAEAQRIHREDEDLCRRMGELGADLLPDPCTVITHCNTGALATAGIGTALGVVIAAHEAGKRIEVIADETRPLLQGARLTAWECQQRGIPVTVQCDGAAGFTLARRKIDAVLVGSDRIVANGDVANKIGTYPLAVLAHRHGVPFYVVAPYSTLDLSLESGDRIPIEEREGEEVVSLAGRRTAPDGVPGWNPAFDVTPAELVTAIITERGVFRAPYRESLAGYARA